MAKKKVIESDVLLSPEEVDYVLKFAQSLAGYGGYNNVLSPFLINQRMQDISLNPLQATETDLANALKNPKNSEIQLQEFSQSFEIQSQVYKKLLSYLGTMLSFDLTYTPLNAKKGEYTSSAYQSDLDIVKKFLDRFDYKNEFANVTAELLRNEAYFCCPRFDMNEKDPIVLQELPSSPVYTMITGRWAYGFLFSLNLAWLILPGVNLDMYPDFFKEKYNELFKGKNKYNPSADVISERGYSSYVLWQDIPIDVGFCFKMNPILATRLPFYSGLFLDLILQPQMRALQRSVSLSTASRLIVGQVPLLNKTTQAGVRDQFSISAKNLGEFLSLVKSAIGDSLKTAALPLDSIQGISFPAENEIYSSFLKTALASSGVNTNLIFTSDIKPNSLESQLSLNVDQNDMARLYPGFEQFMNYHINRQTKKYKFKINFEGFNFFNDREQRLDKQMTLASNGIVLPGKIAAAMSMSPFDFQRQLEEAQATNWVEKLTPIVSAFQQSGKEKTGAPKKSSSKISDSGEETRSSGANIEKKGGKI